MPVVYLVPQICGDAFDDFGRVAGKIGLSWYFRRSHLRKTRALSDPWGEHKRWGAYIFGIRSPFAIYDLDGDEAGQALLLAAAAQGWEFASHCDRWCRDRVLGAVAGACDASFHGLNVVIMPAAGRKLGLGGQIG